MYDLERLGSKIAMGQSNARDLVALKQSLNSLPDLWSLLSNLNSEGFKCHQNIDNLRDLARLIDRAIREDAPPTINEGGIIKTGYNAELDELIPEYPADHPVIVNAPHLTAHPGISAWSPDLAGNFTPAAAALDQRHQRRRRAQAAGR